MYDYYKRHLTTFVVKLNWKYYFTLFFFFFRSKKAGVKHIILAVSYRAEMLEKEMKQQETRVC